jgi:hypothetical protein
MSSNESFIMKKLRFFRSLLVAALAASLAISTQAATCCSCPSRRPLPVKRAATEMDGSDGASPYQSVGEFYSVRPRSYWTGSLAIGSPARVGGDDDLAAAVGVRIGVCSTARTTFLILCREFN